MINGQVWLKLVIWPGALEQVKIADGSYISMKMKSKRKFAQVCFFSYQPVLNQISVENYGSAI